MTYSVMRADRISESTCIGTILPADLPMIKSLVGRSNDNDIRRSASLNGSWRNIYRGGGGSPNGGPPAFILPAS